MAADRMSAELATLTDPWQPGVLALVAHDRTRRRQRRASRSGSAARPPPTRCWPASWSGSGVTSLSAAAAAVTGVGAKLASVTLQQCRDAADAVLTTASASEARAGGAGRTGLTELIGLQSGY